jgi:hypothetical protein
MGCSTHTDSRPQAEYYEYINTSTLYSDCMAAIARGIAALAPGTRTMGHLRNSPICDVLCQQSRVMSRLIKWIKSHPEKRKKMAEFTYEDWGSFLADAAAEGKWQIIRDHLPQVKTHTVIQAMF